MAERTPGSSGPEEPKAPLGLIVRLVIYLVVGHLVAGFLWLLFEAGARSS
ncbi:DUF6126 family protein [Streptomyces sp. NPDC005438]